MNLALQTSYRRVIGNTAASFGTFESSFSVLLNPWARCPAMPPPTLKEPQYAFTGDTGRQHAFHHAIKVSTVSTRRILSSPLQNLLQLLLRER